MVRLNYIAAAGFLTHLWKESWIYTLYFLILTFELVFAEAVDKLCIPELRMLQNPLWAAVSLSRYLFVNCTARCLI